MDFKGLKIKLLERGFTIPELAKAIGISQASIYVKLNGKRDFSYSEVMAIKKTLNLTVDEFNSIFGVN